MKNQTNNKSPYKEETNGSANYQIKTKNPLMKCPRFYLIKDDEVIYTAKLKYKRVYIGNGDGFHIKKNKNNLNQINRDLRGFNIVKFDDQEFKIKYLKNGERFPLKATFVFNDKTICWHPKQSEYKEFIKDENEKKPRNSKRNMILQNSQDKSIFILRKMSKKKYEVESVQEICPFIIFSIAISEIIGPIYI